MSEQILKFSTTSLLLRVDKGMFHLILALVLVPIYLNTGYSFKLVVAPYVFYLVLSRNLAFLPALLVHFLPGTMVSQFILLGCVISCILNVEKLKQLELIRPFFVFVVGLLAILPISLKRALLPEYTIISLGQEVALYLGLSVFFWAAILRGKFTVRVSRQIALILLICLMLQVLPAVEGTIRYYFMSVSLFGAVIASFPFAKSKLYYSGTILAFSLFGLVVSSIGGLNLTFTIAGSTVLSFALIIIAAHGKSLRRYLPLGGILALAIVGVTIYVVSSAERVDLARREIANLGDVQSTEDLMPAIVQKTFGDRAPLWAGTWKSIVSRNQLWPPLRPLSAVTLGSGSRFEEREYGAHNIALELLRQYGLIVGLLAIVVYLGIITRSSVVFFRRETSSELIMLSASAVGCLVVGGISGQFVLMNNFSLLVMSVAGIAFSNSDIHR